ncbi:MAG: hypothetical protein M3445_06915 [Actinomycetota bacterium]|nr:hypothetical protein [Actinomycetota bacterium]
MRMRVGALVVAFIVLAGCGTDEQATGEVAAIELSGLVDQVRAAAEAGEEDTARERLEEVLAAVDDLRGRGELTAEQGARIQAAASDIEQALALLATTTTSATSTPTTTSAPSRPTTTLDAADEDRDEDDKGRGRGKE